MRPLVALLYPASFSLVLKISYIDTPSLADFQSILIEVHIQSGSSQLSLLNVPVPNRYNRRLVRTTGLARYHTVHDPPDGLAPR